MRVFHSGELTASGGADSIAHALGKIPQYVFVEMTDVLDAGSTIEEGAHDITSVIITADADTKFKVSAYAW